MALFVADRRTPVYPTLAAELDAIRTGKKAISFFASDTHAVLDGSDLIPILKPALVRGLAVTASPRGRSVDLIVHSADAANRIAAIQRLLARSPWTFEHEATLGTLLGYTAAQRAAWLAAEHHARPAYGVITLYTVLARDASPTSDATWSYNPGRVVSITAAAKLRPDFALWRVGVDPAFARRMKGREATIADGARAKIMRTPFEELTPRGWRAASRGRAT